MMDLKYSEIVRRNGELKEHLKGDIYSVSVLSNLITYQFNEILEYCLRLAGVNAQVTSGEYDNILQESQNKSESKLVIIFYEIANIIEGFQYKANLLDENELDAFIDKVKSEVAFLCRQLSQTSLVLFNKFSSMIFTHCAIGHNRLDDMCAILNQYLSDTVPDNFRVIDIDKILVQISVEKSVDWRFFYSSRALYTINFYKAYAEYISPIVFSSTGRAKKALIFDCDNTLWKGILGEDGFDRIEMSAKTRDGAIFEEIQHLALELAKRGVILGICSKNNPADVDEVIYKHPDMTLRDDHLVIKMVNWNDKLKNIIALAEKLNIGLDSLVFVDDSDFEINLVKEKLPQVCVLKVPRNLCEYPNMMRRHMGLFYGMSQTEEDRKKSEMYRQNVMRDLERDGFDDIEMYLSSLRLEILFYINERSLIPRLAQMAQKTNQFNLTTKRYTEKDIEVILGDTSSKIYAVSVADRFGDYGITGMAAVRIEESLNKAEIDSLLLSCRILGRNIEHKFFDLIIEDLLKLNIKQIYASYVRTSKNDQVADFYEKHGFSTLTVTDKRKEYRLDVAEYSAKVIPYIEVKHGKQN